MGSIVYQFEARDVDQNSRVTYALRSASPVASSGAASGGSSAHELLNTNTASSSSSMFELDARTGVLKVGPRAHFQPTRHHLLRGPISARPIVFIPSLWLNSRIVIYLYVTLTFTSIFFMDYIRLFVTCSGCKRRGRASA